MCVPIFKQISSLLAWVERWKVGDFVCKKVGIEYVGNERPATGYRPSLLSLSATAHVIARNNASKRVEITCLTRKCYFANPN